MPARYQAVVDADGGPTRYQGLKIFQTVRIAFCIIYICCQIGV
ncbi:Bgt-51986 [Blumeria graminis f. sp. tritici]|uniref:Bgt-51986 n=1 Tax=Blumeria graminis f. sp. tritici TaxID=62690 RepID=A0A9X9QDQ2_BLUGR|nr:Bgt-51986 [Blumeria graminis f. sp. tritici]